MSRILKSIFLILFLNQANAQNSNNKDRIRYECQRDVASVNEFCRQVELYDQCLQVRGYKRVGSNSCYSPNVHSSLNPLHDQIISLVEANRERAAAQKKYEQEKKIEEEQIRVTGWPFYIRQNINGKIYVGGMLVTNPDGTLIFGVQNELSVQGAVSSAQRRGLKNPIDDIPRENRKGSNDDWPEHIRYTKNDRIFVGDTAVTDHEGYLIDGIDGVLGVQGARAAASRRKFKDPLSGIPIRPGGRIPKPMD